MEGFAGIGQGGGGHGDLQRAEHVVEALHPLQAVLLLFPGQMQGNASLGGRKAPTLCDKVGGRVKRNALPPIGHRRLLSCLMVKGAPLDLSGSQLGRGHGGFRSRITPQKLFHQPLLQLLLQLMRLGIDKANKPPGPLQKLSTIHHAHIPHRADLLVHHLRKASLLAQLLPLRTCEGVKQYPISHALLALQRHGGRRNTQFLPQLLQGRYPRF